MTINETPIWGNPLHFWTASFGQAALFLLGFYLLKLIVKRRFANAAETESRVDDFILHAVSKTKVWLLVFPVIYLATRILQLPPAVDKALINLTVVASFVQLGFWVSRLAQFWHSGYRQHDDPSVST